MKLPKVRDTDDEFITPEAGVYKMEFTGYDEPSISDKFPTKQNGEPNWRIKLQFTIDDDSEYDGVNINAWYGWNALNMHPRSRIYPIIKALVGREITEDDDLDLDELVGNHIMGTLDVVKKTQDGQEKSYANLIAASPVRKKKNAKPVVKLVKPKEDDDDDDDSGDTLFDE